MEKWSIRGSLEIIISIKQAISQCKLHMLAVAPGEGFNFLDMKNWLVNFSHFLLEHIYKLQWGNFSSESESHFLFHNLPKSYAQLQEEINKKSPSRNKPWGIVNLLDSISIKANLVLLNILWKKAVRHFSRKFTRFWEPDGIKLERQGTDRAPLELPSFRPQHKRQ